MSRRPPAVLGDEKTTEARTNQPGVVSAYAHSGMRGWRHHMEDSVVAEQAHSTRPGTRHTTHPGTRAGTQYTAHGTRHTAHGLYMCSLSRP